MEEELSVVTAVMKQFKLMSLEAVMMKQLMVV